MRRKSGTILFTGRVCEPRGGEPPAALKEKMAAAFGSVDGCKKELASMAVSQFGSGWGWLVLDGDKLKVVKTVNAETPSLSSSVKSAVSRFS